MTPDFHLIHYLAAWSAAAYEQTTVSDLVTDAEALVTLDGANLIVAFRGSSSLRDFIADARFGRTPLLWTAHGRPAEVHRGFLEQFESINSGVIDQVRNHLTLAPAARVYLTGHSLGGALALLCALEFQRQKIPVTGVVTFGQPRVGNQRFADLYNAALKDITWCVVHAGDPVPLLPPLLSGYRDCGTEVFLQPGGAALLDPFIGWELLADLLGALRCWRHHRLGFLPNHFLAAYQRALTPIQ